MERANDRRLLGIRGNRNHNPALVMRNAVEPTLLFGSCRIFEPRQIARAVHAAKYCNPVRHRSVN
jgi:hypothetical protein